MANTWRGYVQELSIPRMLRTYAERFFGLYGLIADTADEGVKLALHANWLLEPTSPDDVLPKIAKERRLPRYPAEDPSQHRSRLHGAWTTWVDAGSDHNMVTQFAAAGWPGVLIWDNTEIYQWEDPHNTDDVSRFWVILPPGSHSFVSDGNWNDAGTWNDGGLWNSNATTEQIQTMRAIIRKFKPVDWRCQNIVAVVSWDDPTIVEPDNFTAVQWTKGVSTVITGDSVAGPFPGTWGDTVTNTSGSPATTIYVEQTPGNVDAGRPTYFFADAKAGTVSWLLYDNGAGSFVYFDLTNGAIGASGGGQVIDSFIEDLGSGWWRCIAVTDADPALAHWQFSSTNGGNTVPAGGNAYLHQADVYNYKFDEAIVIG